MTLGNFHVDNSDNHRTTKFQIAFSYIAFQLFLLPNDVRFSISNSTFKLAASLCIAFHFLLSTLRLDILFSFHFFILLFIVILTMLLFFLMMKLVAYCYASFVIKSLYKV